MKEEEPEPRDVARDLHVLVDDVAVGVGENGTLDLEAVLLLAVQNAKGRDSGLHPRDGGLRVLALLEEVTLAVGHDDLAVLHLRTVDRGPEDLGQDALGAGEPDVGDRGRGRRARKTVGSVVGLVGGTDHLLDSGRPATAGHAVPRGLAPRRSRERERGEAEQTDCDECKVASHVVVPPGRFKCLERAAS